MTHLPGCSTFPAIDHSACRSSRKANPEKVRRRLFPIQHIDRGIQAVLPVHLSTG
jgi:hypothetical protein